ncbi:hypothetical protein J6590_008064 [Homalodisca vitripennis]|nr:hypothetical protein J6590_008064 [Homalodisca vitripennis]
MVKGMITPCQLASAAEIDNHPTQSGINDTKRLEFTNQYTNFDTIESFARVGKASYNCRLHCVDITIHKINQFKFCGFQFPEAIVPLTGVYFPPGKQSAGDRQPSPLILKQKQKWDWAVTTHLRLIPFFLKCLTLAILQPYKKAPLCSEVFIKSNSGFNI